MVILDEKPKGKLTPCVGCVLVYKNKFVLFYSKKHKCWNSITGHLEHGDKNELFAMKRELSEEVALEDVTPKDVTKLYCQYDEKIIVYSLFYHVLSDEEFESLEPDQIEVFDMNVVTLTEAKKLALHEDELYCLQLVKEELKRVAQAKAEFQEKIAAKKKK